jgi:hypothetical protein
VVQFAGRPGGRARLATAVSAAVATLLTAVLLAPAGAGAAPPSPLPWQRQYVSPDAVDPSQITNEVVADCHEDLERGYRDSGTPGVPSIAVVGDSVEDQTRDPVQSDPAYRWLFATHCGEQFGTLIDTGRLSDVTSANPDVLVFGLGANDMTAFWHVDLSMLPGALANLNRVLDATENVPCRVLVNLPHVLPWFISSNQEAANWDYMTGQLDAAMDAAQARHGVHVADWNGHVSWYWPAYLADGLHLTGTGINDRINLELETARQCFAPDSPANVGSVAANGTAAVWWDPLPAAEHVSQYRVTASDGRSMLTSTNNVNFPGLTNGTAYRFKVSAINDRGEGPATDLTAPVVPSAAGSRFHALTPTRVLDTRYGQGKPGGFLPGENFRLPLNGVVPSGAVAAVLNVTATGQTADTVITAWPSGQSKPLASNLNPRPGVAAAPALVTTRLGPDGAIQLGNGSGIVDLIADVVGYYDAPGASTGSLYMPLAPTRLLDTRNGTGGKTTPFVTHEKLTLPIPALPTGATAAVLNITATNTTAPGFVTVWPNGQAQPNASQLNPQPGLTRANLTIAKVGPDKSVDLFNNSATTDLVIDLVGAYTADGAAHGGSLYYPITPERLYDTRDGTGGIGGPISNGSNLGIAFAGHGAVPTSGAAAVDANVTITNPSAGGHTTVWPSGPKPTASTLNYQPGEIVANRDPIQLSSGTALLWSAAGSINYIVDVSGWWGPPL